MSRIFSHRDQEEMSIGSGGNGQSSSFHERLMWGAIFSAIILVVLGCLFMISSLIWAAISIAVIMLILSLIDLGFALVFKLISIWWNSRDKEEV